MESRQRSPSYPSTPLDEAIDFIKKVHSVERTNPVDRAVAAAAMGYSGITGRSATVLSNLIQYGLLSKTGKNEVRVTQRAIDILYPDNETSKMEALRAAAREPELFQRITERFTDGLPSAAALEAFLIRQGFTHTAIAPAKRAFFETFLFLENAIGSDSYLQGPPAVIESQPNQQVERDNPMAHFKLTAPANPVSAGNLPESRGPVVQMAQRKIVLGGIISTRAEAEELITMINGLKAMLKDEEAIPLAETVTVVGGADDDPT
jgi:hypothetical protein